MGYLLPVLRTLFLLLIGCFLQLTLTLAWTGTMQNRSRLVHLVGHRRFDTRRSFLTQQLFSSRSKQSVHTKAHDNGDDGNDAVDHHHDGQQLPPQNIAIVGGGLAGLSTAFHLLEKSESRCRVTIFDTAPVGTSGASSVAGGLIHPLSPRGKLVHWGREGLEATNRLVAVAEAAIANAAIDTSSSSSPSRIVVRDQLYRLAITEQHVEQLQATANNLAEYCTWWTADELIQAGVIRSTTSSTKSSEAAATDTSTNTTVLGALCLHNGCRVLHVPSYLQGLWAACRERGAVWELVGDDDDDDNSWKTRLQNFDAVVLAAGSGLFSAPTPKNGSNTDSSSLLSRDDFPLQLVRGQSVELRVPDDHAPPSQALLCGKYVSPLPGDPNLYLVGATHEFREDALSPTAVVEELQKLTDTFSSHLWKKAAVERWTMGYRVQSERNQYGRRPMIGRMPTFAAVDANTDASSDEQLRKTPIHPNTWIFTGLSSRGLLFHALYGDILTDALLAGSEAPMLSRCKDLTWWRK